MDRSGGRAARRNFGGHAGDVAAGAGATAREAVTAVEDVADERAAKILKLKARLEKTKNDLVRSGDLAAGGSASSARYGPKLPVAASLAARASEVAGRDKKKKKKKKRPQSQEEKR